MDTNEQVIGLLERQVDRFYGKYRGLVKDNDDPLKQGRIRATVPEVLRDVTSSWALPAAPFVGDGACFFAIPAKGSGVWIEFEAGDVSRPIWTGGWWGAGEAPQDEQSSGSGETSTKILRSDEGLLIALNDQAKTIAISDANGQNLLRIETQQGVLTAQSTVRLVIEAPLILHGENAAHAAVFGDNLLTYLNQLVMMFNMHLHPGELAAGFIPVTPMIPATPFPAATPSLISTKVLVE